MINIIKNKNYIKIASYKAEINAMKNKINKQMIKILIKDFVNFQSIINIKLITCANIRNM